ncbi:hypothetical protein F4809DRAFT_609834 [Biscogniauxia mediterranea]|nr:hypothetical protein F4809DRAFT_609834 [Biscogniauxia mediterranea]
MAEFDDIEYEGIGADRSVKSVGSERCFRDRSPCDTVISLSDDGKGLYSYPVPLFRESSDQYQTQQVQDQRIPPVAFKNGQAAALEYSDITTEAMESRPTSSGSSTTPLGRYRRDVQAHEQLVLGETPHQRHIIPKKRSAEVDEEPGSSSSHPKRLQPSILEDLTTQDPQARKASAAFELAELVKVKNSQAWDDMPIEEQMQLLVEIESLTKYVKAQENKRKNRPQRVRTRNRLPVKKDGAE